MEKFVINGGKPLKGEIDVRGAKNAAFPLLVATILTKEDCTISNLPLIEDVFRMIEILESMGAQVKWPGERTVKINTANLNPSKMKKDLVLQLRGSVLFAGPLLARFGRVNLPQPGGDIIGARPIDTHLDAFSQLGVKIIPKKDGFTLSVPQKLKSQEVILNEFSVTATENILLFAGLQSQKIVLKTADQDYQIHELIIFLEKMGANIEFSGPHAITIQGKKNLRGATHELMADPIEAGTFIVMAAATRGDVLVKNVETQFLELFLKKLQDFGVPLHIKPRGNGHGSVQVAPWRELHIQKIQSFIYPGIHSDLQNVLGVLATQARGSTLLHDPLYEGRLKYLEEINKMGAEIYFTDPHRAIINGPTQLHGRDLGTFDIRGGAALILAALIAKGESTISNIYQVDRGYEKIEERLQKLGADIKRVTF
ncbi:UDP-N-acetylglucosamine 1-carboxyvinyltransferase [Patescibacteria group bacterium]|nr:UDP-N-acetylglucosamine 1-carboxyvinyltransferase [Patescibacteria group bacterium]